MQNEKLILDLNKDIRSMNALTSLTNGYPYLPYTNSAIDFHSIHVIINDIIVNQRCTIIEFGSGISTFLFGRLFKLNKIKAKLYSIDDNEGWFNVMQEMIERENLHEYITLIYAPLEELSTPTEHTHTLPWYSTDVLDKELNSLKFDMVLVDGPMAYTKDIERSRYPALPYMQDKLSDKFSFFLHDTNRDGEISILNNWDQILGLPHERITEKLSGYFSGEQYTITI